MTSTNDHGGTTKLRPQQERQLDDLVEETRRRRQQQLQPPPIAAPYGGTQYSRGSAGTHALDYTNAAAQPSPYPSTAAAHHFNATSGGHFSQPQASGAGPYVTLAEDPRVMRSAPNHQDPGYVPRQMQQQPPQTYPPQQWVPQPAHEAVGHAQSFHANNTVATYAMSRSSPYDYQQQQPMQQQPQMYSAGGSYQSQQIHTQERPSAQLTRLQPRPTYELGMQAQIGEGVRPAYYAAPAAVETMNHQQRFVSYATDGAAVHDGAPSPAELAANVAELRAIVIALQNRVAALEAAAAATKDTMTPAGFAVKKEEGDEASRFVAPKARQRSMDHQGGQASSVLIDSEAPVGMGSGSRYGAAPGGGRGGKKQADLVANADASFQLMVGSPAALQTLKQPKQKIQSIASGGGGSTVSNDIGRRLPPRAATADTLLQYHSTSAAVTRGTDYATTTPFVRAPSPSSHAGTAPTIASVAARAGGTGALFRAGSSASSVDSWANQHTTNSPAPVDPLIGPDVPRRFVVSMLSPAEVDLVQATISRIGNRAELLPAEPGGALPAAATHVVVRDEPASSKALCALVTGRIVVTLEYLATCRNFGFWLDEDQSIEAYRCSPSWPLKDLRVMVNVPNDIMADLVREVMAAGRAMEVDRRTKGSGNVLVVSSPEVLKDYIRKFYSDDA